MLGVVAAELGDVGVALGVGELVQGRHERRRVGGEGKGRGERAEEEMRRSTEEEKKV